MIYILTDVEGSMKAMKQMRRDSIIKKRGRVFQKGMIAVIK